MLNFDLTIFNFIHQLVGRFFLLDWLAIFCAQYLPYFLIIWMAILIFKEKSLHQKYFIAFFSLLSVLLSRGLITEIIRYFYNRARPFAYFNFEPLVNHLPNASFPSGHTSLMFALVIPMFYLNKKAGWWFLVFSFLMAISRVYAGIHWPLDILGGVIIGLGSSIFVKLILSKKKSPM